MRYSELCEASPPGPAYTLFHAAPAPLQQFAPLSHFGTREAALRRAGNMVYQGQPMKLYEVTLASQHPLRVRDLTGKSRSANHNWSNITDMLHYTLKKITAAERDRIYQAAAPFGQNAAAGLQALVDVLHSHGWDALVYRNLFEDAGSQSWINLTAAQIQIVNVTDLTEARRRAGTISPDDAG